jgi:hypothetical protein
MGVPFAQFAFTSAASSWLHKSFHIPYSTIMVTPSHSTKNFTNITKGLPTMSLEKEIHDTLTLFYYGTSPSWALAVVTTFMFACATLVHLILPFLKRSWFMIPLVVGALCTSRFLQVRAKRSIKFRFHSFFTPADFHLSRSSGLCLSRCRAPRKHSKPINVRDVHHIHHHCTGVHRGNPLPVTSAYSPREWSRRF